MLNNQTEQPIWALQERLDELVNNEMNIQYGDERRQQVAHEIGLIIFELTERLVPLPREASE